MILKLCIFKQKNVSINFIAKLKAVNLIFKNKRQNVRLVIDICFSYIYKKKPLQKNT